MKINIKNNFNLFHLFLSVALVAFIFNFFFQTENLVTLELTATVILIYVIFSLIHHYKDKSLTLETFLEYILIASLILILLTGVIVK